MEQLVKNVLTNVRIVLLQMEPVQLALTLFVEISPKTVDVLVDSLIVALLTALHALPPVSLVQIPPLAPAVMQLNSEISLVPFAHA